MTANVGPFTLIDNLAVAVIGVGDDESVAVTVNLDIPRVVGVPVMAPELPARLSPTGSFPEVIDHITGGVPPVAARVAPLYGTPTCAGAATLS